MWRHKVFCPFTPNPMQRSLLFCAAVFTSWAATAQGAAGISVTLNNASGEPLPAATAALLNPDSSIVALALSDKEGKVFFGNAITGTYRIRITATGYAAHFTPFFSYTANEPLQLSALTIVPDTRTMQEVTVTARKPLIELQPGKTVVNVDAGITNTGTSVMEALEKMPGITVDKDGNISLKGRSGVLVLIDGKQTYLGASELATMLQGMSSNSVSQVELMDIPPARLDAAGNAGVINIKTKKTRQQGFNGNISLAAGQGFYPKFNNSLLLNYRSGKWNFSFNYTLNKVQQFMRLYALRRYFEPDGHTVASMLEQPTFFGGRNTTHTLRSGADYAWSKKTTVGLLLTGTHLKRTSGGTNNAVWMNAAGVQDSVIQTESRNNNQFQTGGINLNLRHQFNAKHELSADVDALRYRLDAEQFFENRLLFPRTYREASRAEIPSGINIFSAKADYTAQLHGLRLEGGWKSAHIDTDNEARYQVHNGGNWTEDLGRSNHFLYTENIHALYGGAQTKRGRWDLQAGLRYELTHYDARQLGNAAQKDSSFSRTYDGLFPTLLASVDADSVHRFSFSAGRRIDRPAFQKLNPFLVIINKYTFQQGNPYYRPQYTWNWSVEHQYKGKLITGLSYSRTSDYFAQIFPVKENGIILYTEGNLDLLQVWGLSASVQLAPAKWWSLNAQGVFNYKKLEGFVGTQLKRDISQVSLNMNNQFKLGKGWSGELTGFYTSRSQHDIQEIVDPSGQLSAGIAKMVLKEKGTLKLAVRDMLYTQWMKGNTYFQQADEYFKLTRDTRVATINFTYRFGKAIKNSRRGSSAADDEKARVGTGG